MSNNRIDQLRKLMITHNLQAVVLNPSPNLIYLTGLHYHLFERPIVLIIPLQGDIVAVLPEFEVGKLSNSPIKIKPFSYEDNPAVWANVFKKAANDLGLNSPYIGLDELHFRYLEFQFLSEAMPTAKILPAGDLISSLRIYKDATEIENMEKAVSIAQESFSSLIPLIKPGQTEREIANQLSILLLQNGSDSDNQFDPIIASGHNTANPHHTPGDRKVEKGDPILIDWGAKYHGYYSDLTRNIFMSNPSDQYLSVYDSVKKGNQAGRQSGRPGIPAGNVDHSTRQVIDSLGFGKYFTHRTGHGLGMEEHEPVYIFAENTTDLKPGMVYTVEPGIYIQGTFGVRIEDDIVVTPDGCRSMSDLSRELVVIN